jgi:hypothetical protein
MKRLLHPLQKAAAINFSLILFQRLRLQKNQAFSL